MMNEGLLQQKRKRKKTWRKKMGPEELFKKMVEECKGGNNAREIATNLASMNAMLGKMWVPHLQTGLATMWI